MLCVYVGGCALAVPLDASNLPLFHFKFIHNFNRGSGAGSHRAVDADAANAIASNPLFNFH